MLVVAHVDIEKERQDDLSGGFGEHGTSISSMQVISGKMMLGMRRTFIQANAWEKGFL